MYNKFAMLERKLNKEGFSSRDYCYDVVRLLYGWARAKDFKFIPVPIFCSDFAMNVFRRVHERRYVRTISADEDFQAMVMYGELLVARYSIAHGLSLRDAYNEVRSLVPSEWVAAVRANERPIESAVRILAEENCVPMAGLHTYKDLIRILS